jgi:hypothetical protein
MQMQGFIRCQCLLRQQIDAFNAAPGARGLA